MAPLAVFRCDASPAIGGGHVVRCMALAEALTGAGAEVSFAVSPQTLPTVRDLERGFSVGSAEMNGGLTDLERLKSAWPDGTDLLVVDHYGMGEAFETAASGWATKILVIDDFPNRPHRASYLVDTTLGRTAAEYAGMVPSYTALLCGAEYAMLRGPFRRLRPEHLAAPSAASPRALINFGMTDAPNVTGAVLRALAGLAGELELVVVLGGNAPHLAEVAALVESHKPSCRLVTDASAEGMARLTADCDFVIGAPGSASYERCCLGKPALLIQLAENQAGNAAALAATGAAINIGRFGEIGEAAIERAVSAILHDPNALAAMSAAAFKVTDGRGAERIARLIFDERAG